MNLNLILNRHKPINRLKYLLCSTPLYLVQWSYIDGFNKKHSEITTIYDIEINKNCLINIDILDGEIRDIISYKNRNVISEPYKLKIKHIAFANK